MKKWLRVALISLACLLLIATAGFFLCVSDHYRADYIALAVVRTRCWIEAS